jgi:hypothetical protein
LPLNYPDPTYACAETGHASSNYSTLNSVTGQIRQFPINCPWPQDDPACLVGDHGQVDKNGNNCPAVPNGICSAPDKYDIVGFAPLRIETVLHGDDPAALGVGGATGQCSPTTTYDFTTTTPKLLSTISGTGCPGGITPDNVTPYGTDAYAPYLWGTDHATPYLACPAANCDYTYDATAKSITWEAGKIPTTGVHIEFNWSTNGVAGACGAGVHQSDPNAICLVLSWRGPQGGGGNPGNPGYDFGLRGVTLCDSAGPPNGYKAVTSC